MEGKSGTGSEECRQKNPLLYNKEKEKNDSYYLTFENLSFSQFVFSFISLLTGYFSCYPNWDGEQMEN